MSHPILSEEDHGDTMLHVHQGIAIFPKCHRQSCSLACLIMTNVLESKHLVRLAKAATCRSLATSSMRVSNADFHPVLSVLLPQLAERLHSCQRLPAEEIHA